MSMKEFYIYNRERRDGLCRCVMCRQIDAGNRSINIKPVALTKVTLIAIHYKRILKKNYQELGCTRKRHSKKF